jgi:hypothetical protein
VVNFGTGIVPIVVAVITVTLSPFLTFAISNLTSHNPFVQYGIYPNLFDDGRKAQILLENSGSAPATNLSLTITAPKNITKITNNFSAAYSISVQQLPNRNNSLGIPEPIDTPVRLGIPENITSPTSTLQIKIPKLVQGEGSVIRLQILNNGSSSAKYAYAGAVIYDQGSSLASTELVVHN